MRTPARESPTPAPDLCADLGAELCASPWADGPDPGRGPGEDEAVSDLFRALASPVRIALIGLVADQERCVHELVEALGLPQPLVSQHLRVLRDADLLTRTRRGREVAYVLRDAHVGRIVADAREHSRERPAALRGAGRPTVALAQ